MCKYEMDPASIIGDTEWTRFCPQTDGETDRRTDKVKSVYPTSLSVGYNYKELEQLERLRSEDTPRRLMITHTIGSQVKKIIDLELKTLQSRHDFQSQGQMTLKI